MIVMYKTMLFSKVVNNKPFGSYHDGSILWSLYLFLAPCPMSILSKSLNLYPMAGGMRGVFQNHCTPPRAKLSEPLPSDGPGDYIHDEFGVTIWAPATQTCFCSFPSLDCGQIPWWCGGQVVQEPSHVPVPPKPGIYIYIYIIWSPC